ncbi:Imm27 family immunity protein [Persicitalea sp.]|uniref:Imm27 family immunity protein n=1 Tax=Persicitalea sp. TaxID=3100273 RepID=UPI003594916B
MKTYNQILTGELLDEKLESLIKVGSDEDWNIYYVSNDGEKWRMSYPNSGYHGGGSPELTQVSNFPWEVQD